MAGTMKLSSFGDNEGRQAQFGIDYDDTLAVISMWCDNDTLQPAFGQFQAMALGGTLEEPTLTPIDGDSWAQAFPGKALAGDPPNRTIMLPRGHGVQLFVSPVNPNRLAGVVMTQAVFPWAG